MKTAFIFPGQGSQAIGMMSQLAAAHPIVKSTFLEASDALGFDLWALCQNGPLDVLSQTANTQPALLTAGIAAWRVWQEQGGAPADMMAGHSLGEYTALVAAGAMTFSDGVTLVRDRGQYMQDAGQGAMAAIIGLDDQQVRDVCATASEGDALQAVNFNAPGQVVIAGSTAAIERAMLQMKEAGAKRALPLPVSIPAHSSLMTPAVERLAQRLADIQINMPTVPVLHNCNVQVAQSSDEIVANLVTQLNSPVRWVESVNAMHAEGVELFIESGPGKVLGGMVKRIIKGVNIACIEQPDALAKLVAGAE